MPDSHDPSASPPGAAPRMPHALATRLVHAAGEPDPATGAVMPAIHPSTTFARDERGELLGDFIYGREGNPTRERLERALAEVEGGVDAAAFASGVGAISAVFLSLAAGDHVIVTEDCYYGAQQLLRTVLDRWSLDVSFVDTTDPQRVADAMTPTTRLLWLESPSNPCFRITDLAACTAIARERGVLVAADDTWTTPVFQRPFELDPPVDLVMHSTTKYLAGHSDVTGGAVICRERTPFWERLRGVQANVGAVPSPFDAWLVLRGLRTLGVRMAVHDANARRLAEALSRHPRVTRVHHPALAAHPGHDVARRQSTGAREVPGAGPAAPRGRGRPGSSGGMLAFEVDADAVDGGAAVAARVVQGVQLFTRGTSLGGPESLIEHRAAVEGPGTKAPAGLLRVSVGLEDADDLVRDLEQAIDGATAAT